MAIDFSVFLPQGGGVLKPGSQDMTPEQKKMLTLGLLSNAFTNLGNLGEGRPNEPFMPGLLSMQTMFNKQNEQASRAKKMQEAFNGAMVRDPVQTPGYSVGSNWAKDQPTAQFMADQNRSINEMNDQPASTGMGMAETFGLNDYADLFPRAPQESEAMVPEEKTTLGDPRFDMSRAMQGLMGSGDPELMMQGFSTYADMMHGGKDGRTAEQKNFEYAMTLPEDQRKQFMAKNSGVDPSAIVEDRYVREMIANGDKEGVERFFAIKRAQQWRDFGGYQAPALPLGGLGPAVSNTMRPGEAADTVDRRRKMDYELPQQQRSFSVTDPDGGVHVFKSQQDADRFKRAIGGK